MKLNRHNYEEYFILYLDNELNSEGRREVELFANEHPDLKAELDMLLQSKLSPDTDITFTNKESLLVRDSSDISLNNHEEWLLSYVDNELTSTEIKDVERFIAAHPEVKTELGLLQKTKLQADTIVFPDKESLYRKEEKAKVVAFHWKRWAVAAALLIGISTTAFVLLNNKKQGEPAIAAGKTEKTPTDNNTNRQPQNTVRDEKEVLAVTNDQKEGTSKKEATDNTARIKKDNVAPQEKKEDVLPVKNETLANNQSDPENKRGNNLPKPENNPNVNSLATVDINTDLTAQINPKATLTNNNNTTGATSVTPKPSDTYHTQEPPSGIETDNPDAVFASNDGKKNKLRGFFRKITRTFEKRTNIKATDNEDDRLLIAGLAIKLN